MFLPDAEVEAALDSRFAGRGASLWLALSTTEPELAAGVLTGVTEPTAGSWARIEVTPAEWSTSDRVTEALVVVPDPVDDLGVIVAWALSTAAMGGTWVAAGVPAEEMDLQAGSSNVTVTARIEAPADLITI